VFHLDNKKENKNEEEEKNQLTSQENRFESDPFTKMMFGANPPRRYRENTQADNPTTENSTELNQQQDYTQYYTLMQQVDDILGSVDRMKPVLKELSPLLRFLKKWK
jgi:hypothetical protein